MSDISKKDTVKEEAAKNETKKDSPKDKKDGFGSRIAKFFREIRSELKKISWPTFAEVVKNTIITLVVCAILGIIIGLFDWGVSSLRDWAILQARSDEAIEETTDITSDSDSVDINLEDAISEYLSSSDAE